MSDSKVDQILSHYDSKKEVNEQFTEKIKILVTDLLKSKDIEIHSIEARLKDRNSFKKKVQKNPDKVSTRPSTSFIRDTYSIAYL